MFRLKAIALIVASLFLNSSSGGDIKYQNLSFAIPSTGQIVAYDSNGPIQLPETGDDFFGQDANNNLKPTNYVDNGNGTVLDVVTRLTWMKKMQAKMTLAEAQVALQELNKKVPSDWRIPSVTELYSLILYSGQVFGDKSVKLFIDTRYFEQPIGDVQIGEREIDAQVWSSTPFNGITMVRDRSQFGVNFVDGRIKAYSLNDPRNGSPNRMFFRFVRGNPEYGKNKFIDNGDGTISDYATGLMWQKSDSRKGQNWKDALAYCRRQTTGGFHDWRMPSAKELQSIVDYSVSYQVDARPAASPLFDFTKTTRPDMKSDIPFFWTGTTLLDGPIPGNMAIYVVFGTALAKPFSMLVDAHGSGAVRADPKIQNSNDIGPVYFGPQRDLQVVLNFVRCVRTMSPR